MHFNGTSRIFEFLRQSLEHHVVKVGGHVRYHSPPCCDDWLVSCRLCCPPHVLEEKLWDKFPQIFLQAGLPFLSPSGPRQQCQNIEDVSVSHELTSKSCDLRELTDFDSGVALRSNHVLVLLNVQCQTQTEPRT